MGLDIDECPTGLLHVFYKHAERLMGVFYLRNTLKINNIFVDTAFIQAKKDGMTNIFQNVRTMRWIAALFVALLVVGLGVKTLTDKPSVCEGQQFSSPEEAMNCRYPYPPIGRWHAVYTEQFAQEYNLPPKNISTDLSPGIDYMEMDVQPYGRDGTACLVNMLVKKPHDIALYRDERGITSFPPNRKLLHLVDIDKQKGKLKPLITFQSAARDYKTEKSGYRASTFGMYVEDVLPGYDYVSVNKHCRDVSMHETYFPDGYAFWVNKASIWGRYEMLHRNHDHPDTPKGQGFYDSHFFINIPHELVSKIFEDVPIGGR